MIAKAARPVAGMQGDRLHGGATGSEDDDLYAEDIVRSCRAAAAFDTDPAGSFGGIAMLAVFLVIVATLAVGSCS